MPTVSVVTDVAAPPATVFGVIADFSQGPRWQPNMRSARWTSPGPPRVVSTFEQTDVPLDLPSTENKPDESLPADVMNTGALWNKAARVDPISARWYLIAFHKRFALPTAQSRPRSDGMTVPSVSWPTMT